MQKIKNTLIGIYTIKALREYDRYDTMMSWNSTNVSENDIVKTDAYQVVWTGEVGNFNNFFDKNTFEYIDLLNE